jgi:DNA-binding transcriptional ArsR family regulator
MRTATGMEDQELPLLQRICSLELPASEIAAQINASQSSSNRHISRSTDETVNQAIMVELLQRNHY